MHRALEFLGIDQGVAEIGQQQAGHYGAQQEIEAHHIASQPRTNRTPSAKKKIAAATKIASSMITPRRDPPSVLF
jgi:hypothetical protein